MKAEKKKLKEDLTESKVEGKPFEEELRARVVGALASGPPLTAGEAIGVFFTLPMIIVDASA